MSTRIQTQMPTRVPAGASSTGDGVILGSGPVAVDAYIDFLCPFCRQFEERAGAAIDDMLDAGAITMVYHPLGFLDRLSTTRYSSRAGAASGCASDGGRFREYSKSLFANQPPEGGPGLSDDQLIDLGLHAGLDRDFGACVRAKMYVPWVGYVTERALERGVSGTPSVFVAGTPVPANASTIVAAVAAAGRRSPRMH